MASTARPPAVSLVIPARNASTTLGRCLDAVRGMKGHDGPDEIIVVDDGSTDQTGEVGTMAGARVLHIRASGPAAARNCGWRAANGELVWFVDADCVPRCDALVRLRSHLSDPEIAGAGGSYENLNRDSLNAWMIQDEITVRHARMIKDPWLLGTFNVLYRRSVLAEVSGFNERLHTAEDADLSYRIREAGYRFAFDRESVVGHFHETRWPRYLRTQARHGFWRAHLYRQHAGRIAGDGYSGVLDHLQIPLAGAAFIGLALAPFSRTIAPIAGILCAGLLLMQAPMMVAILRRAARPRAALYPLWASVRALARAAGGLIGIAHAVLIGSPRPQI